MQRVSKREWCKKTEQPQINADKDKTAKRHEWTRTKIEREHVHRLEGSRASSSSSNPVTRSDGVLERWSTAPSPNCTRVAGRDAEKATDVVVKTATNFVAI
jgi:hypothetical protein